MSLKPDNVMVGADGRVRVMDFGVASSQREGKTSANSVADAKNPQILSTRLTQVGALVGTPRYMAPEQFLGGTVTAAADQFAFSVTLWEMLYGERPFEGSTLFELATRVLSGKKPVAPRRGVPAWLRRICERGLAPQPEGRFPALADLLSALERGQVRARNRWLGVSIAAGVLLALGVTGQRTWQHERAEAACVDAGSQIDEVWNDDARDRVRRGLLGSKVSYASTVPNTVLPWLDEQAQAWRVGRRQVCEHETIARDWSAVTLDQASWCLEERRVEFEALVEAFTNADGGTAQRAVAAASSLAPVVACLDTVSLALGPAPPSVDVRVELETARRDVALAAAFAGSGQYTKGLELAQKVAAQEVVATWPPLLARALALQGEFAARLGRHAEAEAALVTAFDHSARVGDWNTAARATTHLINTVGVGANRPEEARVWARFAEVAAVRAGDPTGALESFRLFVLAALENAQGRYDEASALAERSAELAEAAFGPEHPDLSHSLGLWANIMYAKGEYERARELQTRVLAIRTSNLAEGHPDVAQSLNTLGAVAYATGDYPTAVELQTRAFDIRVRAFGMDHAEVAATLTNLALSNLAMGEFETAKASAEQALAIQEKVLGSEHPLVGAGLTNLALVRSQMGDEEGAIELNARALAIYETSYGPEHPMVATGLKNQAGRHLARGEFDVAYEMLLRALEIREKALGVSHPEVASVNLMLASLEEQRGRAKIGLVHAERAHSIYRETEGIQPGENEAAFALARLLEATNGDTVRALDLGRSACAGFEAASEAKAAADCRAWVEKVER